MAVVVIDPGHGGTVKVGGSSPNNATSPSGLLEKNLTLAVARHAETSLHARGHTVRLTRTEDVNVGLAARAAVAKAARADVFVSIHFNGFADPTVQGTETWVHQSAAARSQALAGAVQRAVLQATRHRDRGVKAKVLGVLDPVHFDGNTAACLAELSFITTTAEDERLQDPLYLQALGEALAGGVQAFVDQSVQPLEMAIPVAAGRVGRGRVARVGASATRVPMRPSVAVRGVRGVGRAPADLSGAAIAAPPLADVRQAVDGVPRERPAKVQFGGQVISDGDPNSHIQGLAGCGDYFLLTHSDRSQPSGRLLVVDRRPRERKKVAEFPLPDFGIGGPALYHAGGCQVLGDVLAVPSESGGNSSVVAFFDVASPLDIRELHASLRIARTDRDAAAAGLTTVTRDGRTAWLCAVYDSGSVDFYESPDLPGGAAFVRLFDAPMKVQEKHHQALLLFTDVRNRVFAAGLSRGDFPYFDKLVLYEVDFVGHEMRPDPDRKYSTGGGSRLRWGAALEVVGNRLVLHCTERNYGRECDIKTFDASPPPPARARGRKHRKTRKPSARAVAGTRASTRKAPRKRSSG